MGDLKNGTHTRRLPVAEGPVQPRLLALATAVPPHRLDQAQARARVGRLFAGMSRLDKVSAVFERAGVETRYSCVPAEWHDEPHGWAERNKLYVHHAVVLLEKVTRDCLDQAELGPSELDAIVVVSTTGISTPSLDALLMERLSLRRDVQRLPIFGLGCAGGVLGLARAASLARALPGSRVLFLVVELCTLCFRSNDRSQTNFIVAALFGDGAAGAIISSTGDGPRLGPAGEHTWPATLDVMGWQVEDDGFQALLSRDVPMLVRRGLRDAAVEFLRRHGLCLADLDSFVCHPGGAKVLLALEEAFGVADGTFEARQILRDYGNMSAATFCSCSRPGGARPRASARS